MSAEHMARACNGIATATACTAASARLLLVVTENRPDDVTCVHFTFQPALLTSRRK